MNNTQSIGGRTMAIKLTPTEKQVAEWAVAYMSDLDADERDELYGTAEIAMPQIVEINGDVRLVLGAQDTTDDLLYRVADQYLDVAGAGYLHDLTDAQMAGQKRAARTLAEKLREAGAQA